MIPLCKHCAAYHDFSTMKLVHQPHCPNHPSQNAGKYPKPHRIKDSEIVKCNYCDGQWDFEAGHIDHTDECTRPMPIALKHYDEHKAREKSEQFFEARRTQTDVDIHSLDAARFKKTDDPSKVPMASALDAAREFINDPDKDNPEHKLYHVIVIVGRKRDDGNTTGTRYFQSGSANYHEMLGLFEEAKLMMRESAFED